MVLKFSHISLTIDRESFMSVYTPENFIYIHKCILDNNDALMKNF